jgi:hypothetical protein
MGTSILLRPSARAKDTHDRYLSLKIPYVRVGTIQSRRWSNHLGTNEAELAEYVERLNRAREKPQRSAQQMPASLDWDLEAQDAAAWVAARSSESADGRPLLFVSLPAPNNYAVLQENMTNSKGPGDPSEERQAQVSLNQFQRCGCCQGQATCW